MTRKVTNHTHQEGRPKTARTESNALRELARKTGSRASISYLKLVAAFPLHPLRSDEELDEAIEVLDNLLVRKKPLDPQEQGYVDSLSNEIRRYEEANIPMPAVTSAGLLRHLIDSRNATLSEVTMKAGIAVSTISSVLSGKRQLNLRHIEKLANYFGVAPKVFLN